MRETPSPPPSQEPQADHDETPSHTRERAQIPSLFSGGVDSAREALVEELRRVPKADLSRFLSTIMPFSSLPERLRTDSGIDAVMAALQSGSYPALRKHGDTYTWTSFPVAPKDDGSREPDVFRQLEDVVTDITKAAGSLFEGKRKGASSLKANFRYKNNGHKIPTSEHRDNSTRPDGYFLLPGTLDPNKPSWADIAILGEFKKDESKSDVDDEIKKVLWGMNHVMRDDPLRRATYGFTIENTKTRLWYCDRTQIIASTVFDFFQDPRSLVQFILTALYADNTSLGWDPSIRRLSDTEKDTDVPCQYEITVHDHLTRRPVVYRTLELLSDLAADGIVGRGTRVWSAYRKGSNRKDPANIKVVKDYWVDVDRDREGDIYRAIRLDLGKSGLSPMEREVLDHHLPTTDSDGNVLIGTTLVSDVSPALEGCLMQAEQGVPAALDLADILLRPRRGPSQTTPSSPYSESSYVDAFFPWKPLRLSPRIHYRIVYNELGYALHDEQSLSTAFRALQDVVQCLLILNQVGWVHRDISTGNILICKADKRGLLTDLEYAQRWNVPRVQKDSHDTYCPPPIFEGASLLSGAWANTSLRTTPKAPGPPFRYHPLNDWESLFWVAMYMVVDRAVVPSSKRPESPHNKLETQRTLTQSLFDDHPKRRSVITEVPKKATTDTLSRELSRCLHDDLQFVGEQLALMRTGLAAAYIEAEAEESKPADGYKSLKLVSVAEGAPMPCYFRICAHLAQPDKADITVQRFPKQVEVPEKDLQTLKLEDGQKS